jgi:hypothetical protein
MKKKGVHSIRDFFKKFDSRIIPEPNSGCWLWIGAIHRTRVKGCPGYGVVMDNGRGVRAHRAAYECTHGEGSADGLMVRHRCDTTLCVNPDHLELGTHTDNMRDMKERSRHRRTPDRHAQCKLSDDTVRQIRDLSYTGATYRSIAARFGVNPSMVSLIARGKRRWHVEPRQSSKPQRAD